MKQGSNEFHYALLNSLPSHSLSRSQECTVEVPEEYVGSVVDLLGKRKGVMMDLSTG